MTDLERLFRLLVQTLAAADPARLHRPLILGELQLDVLEVALPRLLPLQGDRKNQDEGKKGDRCAHGRGPCDCS